MFFRCGVIFAFFISGIMTIDAWELTLPHEGHRYSVGPEVMHVDRTKEGGSEQSGWMYGGRVVYERLLSNAFYWGAEAEYAIGPVEGRSARGRPLKSDLSDLILEGRLGYALRYRRVVLVPFIGGGYFCEHNHFKPPTPLLLVFRDNFYYGTGGFLSRVFVNDDCTIGLDFKVRWPWEGKDKAMGDPDFPPAESLFESEIQYLVDLPITYKFCMNGRAFEASLIPFWEQRHFGGREAFPFDFIDTRFQIVGVRLIFTYCL